MPAKMDHLCLAMAVTRLRGFRRLQRYQHPSGPLHDQDYHCTPMDYVVFARAADASITLILLGTGSHRRNLPTVPAGAAPRGPALQFSPPDRDQEAPTGDSGSVARVVRVVPFEKPDKEG
jgi:hypothetical protein